MLAITFCPQLVALVASAADSPPDGSGSAGGPGGRTVWVLAVLLLGPWPGKVGVHAHVLLELLESIVRPLAHVVKPAAVHVAVRDMAVGEESSRGDRVVR
jgi:hypothetical protein